MSVTIPLRNDLPNYTLSVVLDGLTYSFDLIWNYRSEQWIMNIYDGAGDMLVAGCGVVVDFPLAARIQDPRMPPGMLQAYDTSGAHEDPGMADLGSRVILVYFSAAEVAQIIAGGAVA